MLDLRRPPYIAARALLEALRDGRGSWREVACRLHHVPGEGMVDLHGPARARVAHLLQLEATADDRDLLRFLLDQEIAARRGESGQGGGPTLSLLSALLLDHGDEEDVWRFWCARRANFDTMAGAYDLEFVFAAAPPERARALVEHLGGPSDRALLARLDLRALRAGLPAWRARLTERFPRAAEDLDAAEVEAWAELFGDDALLERLALARVADPEELARHHRGRGRHAEAVDAWLQALAGAEAPWDRLSVLARLLEDAAEAPRDLSEALAVAEALWPRVPGLGEVGLGRQLVVGVLRLAAATESPELGGRALDLGLAWGAEVSWLPLAGLEAGLTAARRWGQPAQVEALQRAVGRERRRLRGEQP